MKLNYGRQYRRYIDCRSFGKENLNIFNMGFFRLLLGILLAITIVSSQSSDNATCSPWLGFCRIYDDCCRYLTCLTYTARCVPKEGIIVPGEDTRPIGNGPFPPGYRPN